MANAIEADGLIKTYGKDVKALDGLSFERGGRDRVRAARPQRRRQVDRGEDPHDADAAPDAGTAAVAGIDVAAQPDRVRRSIGVVAQGSGVDVQATGRENIRLQGHLYGLRGGELERARRPSCSRLRARRRGRQDRARLLGRDAAAPGHRDGARPRPPGAVSRRADDRPRPRGPGRHVERDRRLVAWARARPCC